MAHPFCLANLARTASGGLAIALALLVLPASADERPAPGDPAEADQIARWIHELGSERFAVRERASRQLIEAGIVAHDALAAAAADPDAEVRVRAKAALSEVSAADFRDRLEAFAADFDGKGQHTLPGWDRFSAIFGTSIVARHLFVEMQRSEGELFETLANDPEAASDALEQRCRSVVKLVTTNYGARHITLGTTASVLFIAAASEVHVDDYLGAQFIPWLVYQPSFHKEAQGTEMAPLLRKLVGMWTTKPAGPAVSAENMKLAAIYELKSEAVAIARRMLGDERSPGQARQNALMLVGRYGDASDVTLAEKFLADVTPCGNLQMPGIGRQVEFQLRDVALSVAVQLSGQKLTDYGYVYTLPQAASIFLPKTLLFPRTQDRDKALKKWGEWRSEHPATS